MGNGIWRVESGLGNLGMAGEGGPGGWEKLIAKEKKLCFSPYGELREVVVWVKGVV